MSAKDKLFIGLLATLGLACLWPAVPPAAALAAGLLLALVLGNPYAHLTAKASRRLLAVSVVGLGAGMDLAAVARAGLAGLGYTFAGIAGALLLGIFLGKVLKAERDTSLLVSAGTAICGGSAIAAIAPVIRAEPPAVAVALGTVFILNAVALVIFPPLGHHFGLSEHQFGLWAALAIHDTSSVVGATMQYGAEALQTGTTVKLARALWIVPLALLFGYIETKKGAVAPEAKAAKKNEKTAKPWFILGFLLMAALFTYIPALAPAGETVAAVARRLLVLTLFLIGANLTLPALRAAGLRPLVQGVILWLVVSAAALGAVMAGVIR